MRNYTWAPLQEVCRRNFIFIDTPRCPSLATSEPESPRFQLKVFPQEAVIKPAAHRYFPDVDSVVVDGAIMRK